MKKLKKAERHTLFKEGEYGRRMDQSERIYAKEKDRL